MGMIVLSSEMLSALKEAIEIAQANIYGVYRNDISRDFFQMEGDAKRAMGEVETIADILGIEVEHYDYSPEEGQIP